MVEAAVVPLQAQQMAQVALEFHHQLLVPLLPEQVVAVVVAEDTMKLVTMVVAMEHLLVILQMLHLELLIQAVVAVAEFKVDLLQTLEAVEAE
jgi:hypothetical protein